MTEDYGGGRGRASDFGADAFNPGRMRVSNNAANTYSSGNLITAGAFTYEDTAYDALFVAKLVPEPASAAVGALGFGLLALVRRRR